MPRIPLIKFPKRNLKGPSPSAPAASQPADQHATIVSRLGAKTEAPSSGGIKNYRFMSDVPSPPSHTAVGGPASLLPKRKPLTEEEIEAIMLGAPSDHLTSIGSSRSINKINTQTYCL